MDSLRIQNGNLEPTHPTLLARPRLDIDPEKRRIALLLTLDTEDVMTPTMLERITDVGFNPKAEFHVTAIDIKSKSDAAQAFDSLNAEQQTVIMDSLAAAETQSWQVTPLDEFYMLEKQYTDEDLPRQSIIQMVDCPDLEDLYANLNALTISSDAFEIPPAHITLAIQNSARGIGVGTADELAAIATPYTFPDTSIQ